MTTGNKKAQDVQPTIISYAKDLPMAYPVSWLFLHIICHFPIDGAILN